MSGGGHCVAEPMIKNVAVLAPFGILVIGASSGGVPALISLPNKLPKNLPVPIAIAQQCASNRPSYLPEIVRRLTIR